MKNRYFQRYATEVYCDKCKEFVEWFNWYGHFYCCNCKEIIGFPSGKLCEPHKWNIEATGLIKIPYKHKDKIFNANLYQL